MSKELATIEPTAVEARSMAERIMPMFPRDCNREQALEVARIALAYQLDPFLGELIPYQGKPYLTFDGRIRIADRHEQYDGYDLLPPSDVELKALRPAENESIWKCVVYRKDRTRPTVAYGRAGGPQDRNPVGKSDSVTMAQKRAIHRALRAAFPVPIPGLEEHLSPEQQRAIHAFDEAAGVSPDERRSTLQDTFDVESSADLTKDQASTYIDGRAVLIEVEESLLDPTDRERDEILMLLYEVDDTAGLRGLRDRIRDAHLTDDAEVMQIFESARNRLVDAPKRNKQQQALAS